MTEKTIIRNLWLKSFPSLKAYTQNKFYKITGPFVVGIELIKLPHSNEYRPHFVVYNLYSELPMEFPVILSEFCDIKKRQINVSYNKIEQTKKAIDIFLKEKILTLETEVNSKIIKTIFDNKLRNNNIIIKTPQIFRAKFILALYLKDQKECKLIVKKIKKAKSTINKSFHDYFEKNINQWLIDIFSLNRENIIINIKKNKENEKLKKLLYFEVVKTNKQSLISIFKDKFISK